MLDCSSHLEACNVLLSTIVRRIMLQGLNIVAHYKI
jgi:hypothetical protein